MMGAQLGLLAAATLLLAVPLELSSPRLLPSRAAGPSTGSGAPGHVRRWIAIALRPRAAARRDTQLADLLERIGSGLRAGLALGPAFVAAAEGSPEPLGAELAPMGQALRRGAALGEELDRWATGVGTSPDVRLVATALDLSREAGGATSRAVDRVAATLRERRELRAEALSLATQARASAGVLAIAPLLFTGLVATIEPGAAAVLVTTPLGAACLVLGLTLQALGAAWMARIVRSAW